MGARFAYVALVSSMALFAACRNGATPGIRGGDAGADTAPGSCGPTLAFADPMIEAAVRSGVGKPTGDLAPADVAALDTLSVTQAGVIDLGGIGCLTGLRALDLSDNDLLNVSELGALTGLTTLRLGGNDIEDLAPLGGLTGLAVLDVSRNELTSVAPLAGLTGLAELYASGNELRDLTPLAALGGLRVLDLGGNGLFDAAPLAGLTGLQRLVLAANPLDDFAPLAALTHLQALDLTAVDVGSGPSPLARYDLGFLSGMTGLAELHLRGQTLVSLAPLRPLVSLQILDILDADIAKPFPLAQLGSLVELSVSPTLELLPLPTSLHKLYASSQLPSLDVSSLTSLESLTGSITGLTGVDRLTHLTTMQIDLIDPDRLPVFAAGVPLRTLQIDAIQSPLIAGEIASLASLTALEDLELTERAVPSGTDLTVLAPLTALRTLVIDASPARLPALPSLQVLHAWMPLPAADLSALTSLVELQLTTVSSPPPLADELEALSSLTTLTLNVPGGLDDARRLTRLPQLRSLTLFTQPPHWDEVDELAVLDSLTVVRGPVDHLPSMPRLRTLAVVGVADTASWPDLPRLRTLALSGTFGAAAVAGLSRFAITDLTISGSSTEDLFPHALPHVRRLTPQVSTTTTDASHIADLPELQHLSLPNLGTGVLLLGGHPRLRSIQMLVQPVMLTPGDAAFPHLVRLRLALLNDFSTASMPALRELQGEYDPSLSTFNLAATPRLELLRMDSDGDMQLPVLGELRTLTGTSGATLALPTMPHLRSVDVAYGAYATLPGPPVTIQLDTQPELRELRLGEAYTSSTLGSYAFLASCPALQDLEIESLDFNDAGVLALLPNPSKLRQLSLQLFSPGARIQIAPASLSALAPFTSLEQLILPAGNLTDLSPLPSLPALTTLELDFAPPSLAGIPSLPSLNLLAVTPQATTDFSALANDADLGTDDLLYFPTGALDCNGSVVAALHARGVNVTSCP
jgi:Leucine-rich repeat (LRR) protein